MTRNWSYSANFVTLEHLYCHPAPSYQGGGKIPATRSKQVISAQQRGIQALPTWGTTTVSLLPFSPDPQQYHHVRSFNSQTDSGSA